jgi:hypothetical protein
VCTSSSSSSTACVVMVGSSHQIDELLDHSCN